MPVPRQQLEARDAFRQGTIDSAKTEFARDENRLRRDAYERLRKANQQIQLDFARLVDDTAFTTYTPETQRIPYQPFTEKVFIAIGYMMASKDQAIQAVGLESLRLITTITGTIALNRLVDKSQPYDDLGKDALMLGIPANGALLDAENTAALRQAVAKLPKGKKREYIEQWALGLAVIAELNKPELKPPEDPRIAARSAEVIRLFAQFPALVNPESFVNLPKPEERLAKLKEWEDDGETLHQIDLAYYQTALKLGFNEQAAVRLDIVLNYLSSNWSCPVKFNGFINPLTSSTDIRNLANPNYLPMLTNEQQYINPITQWVEGLKKQQPQGSKWYIAGQMLAPLMDRIVEYRREGQAGTS